jgi:signal peptidase I
MRIDMNVMRHLWVPIEATAVLGCFFIAGCAERVVLQKSTNMVPTIAADEAVRVDMRAYRHARPCRWDVVVFQSVVGDPAAFSIMRVVGLPGEAVSFGRCGLLINGLPCVTPPALRYLRYAAASTNGGLTPLTMPYTTPDRSHFVIGDNIANSYDSRYWGAVPESNVLGKVLLK